MFSIEFYSSLLNSRLSLVFFLHSHVIFSKSLLLENQFSANESVEIFVLLLHCYKFDSRRVVAYRIRSTFRKRETRKVVFEDVYNI